METVVNPGSQIVAQENKDIEARMFTDDSSKECLMSGLFYSQGQLGTIKDLI